MAEDNEDQQSKSYPALVRHPDVTATWRYGMVVWLVAALVLLLTSDLGSGVTALTQTVSDERLGISFQSQEQVLLEASVFTSVGELWKAGSKPLAVFVVITSIAWPYVKLLLTFYAWVAPIRHPQRREWLLTGLDLLGKWSFADVVVFTVIVVVFRETINIGAGFLEVWIVPQWGLFGFISASMLSLVATHAVLYHHRRIMYKQSSLQDTSPRRKLAEHARMSSFTNLVLSVILLISFGAYLAGCILHFFKITNSQSGLIRDSDKYSLIDIGKDLPDSGRDDENTGGLRYLQIVWFLLGVAMPLLSILMMLALLWRPMNLASLRTWLLVSEVTLSWSCSEVFLLSTVLAIKEVPTFGEGLIDTGCSQCYKVDTVFMPEVVSLAIGTATSLLVSLYVMYRAHEAAYSMAEVPPSGDEASSAS